MDENKAKHLQELFGELTHDVQMNLEPQNRERFTSNLTNFRCFLLISWTQCGLVSIFSEDDALKNPWVVLQMLGRGICEELFLLLRYLF